MTIIMKRRQHNAGGSGVILCNHHVVKSTNINRGSRGREIYRSTTSRSWQKCEKEHTPTTTTRLYSSGSNDNGDGDDNNNFFSKAIKAVKSFLPKQLFDESESSSSGNENENESNNRKQESQIEQRQQQAEMTNEFSGSIKEILKDAPLGVRMMGEIISPIIGGLLSTVGGIVAEQQRTIEDVMYDAKIYMQLDQSVTDMLGTTTISLGSPISQSSSTSIINGNAQSRIELTIPVYSGSSYSTSTVQVLAINNVITQMELNDNGRRISVSLASQSPTYSTDTSNISSSSSSKTMSRGNDDDMIIEAEIIDKQTKQ
ncbi:hypothetical protein FRACYDRAFT_257333 [Fragilariopsis cylindrus CCMP1102]|uniref:Uncharacterized protein n=1 Tax=Fragilariopsis cylindrus CCMP1102 TaxID=635003 RepID=A0A1E7EJ75_9STRA|nr:hypothetical protein FRACYDRAFT_257333 [Fragilariopsis cylindrus CCMP1102]|eukprot:OEU05947.1 hypothetical protein FRACYDRAFT_257333 [Fragilariopsis cylindrus CCMP1102]